MARILRARNPLSPKTPRDVSGTSGGVQGTDKWSGSKHDPAQLTKITRAKSSIRRLMVKNPSGNPNEREVMDQFTNNPNPKFDPSKHPGTVSKTTSVKRMSVGTAGRGHGKVIKPNRQSLFGGKTIRKRTF